LVPALRKVREGLGTHDVAAVGEVKSPGHSPFLEITEPDVFAAMLQACKPAAQWIKRKYDAGPN
jgi:hypothetical protein